MSDEKKHHNYTFETTITADDPEAFKSYLENNGLIIEKLNRWQRFKKALKDSKVFQSKNRMRIEDLEQQARIAGGVHFRNIRDLRLEMENLQKDTTEVDLVIMNRLNALEGKKPDPDKAMITNLVTLKAFINNNTECLRQACIDYKSNEGDKLKEESAKKIQDIVIANSNLERHPSWGPTGHWDAFYVPELDVIVDWIKKASEGGRIIDKTQWHIDEWYEQQKAGISINEME